MASEQHNRKRNQIQAKLTRISDWFNKEDPANINHFAIEERLDQLSSIDAHFDNHQQSLYDTFKATKEVTFKDLQEEQAPHEEHFEDLMFKTKVALKTKLANLTSKQQKQENKTPSFDFRLPAVTLPTFSGKPYRSWIDFRENFDALICKSDLPAHQKMFYLVGALKDDARNVIGDPQYTDEGFKQAWATLLARYNNTRVLVESCISELCNLTSIVNPTAETIRTLIDTVSSNISTLKSLQQPVEHYDRFIVFLVTSSLDQDSRQYWENSLKSDTLPTWSELHAFLEQRFRVLESLQASNASAEPEKSSHQKPIVKQVNSVTPASKLCIFCSNHHNSIFQCECFADKVDLSERVKIVQQFKACFNCLKVGHKQRDCFGGTCKHCHQKHHSLLHGAMQNQQSSSQNIQQEKKETTTTHNSSNNRQVLLTTAVVSVIDSRGVSHKCRALLDNGAQSNLITERLVTTLSLNRDPTLVQIAGVNSATSTVKHSVNLTVSSCTEHFSRKIECLVVNQVVRDLPSQVINTSTWGIPDGTILADPNFNVPAKIDLLLAADTFYAVLKGAVITLSEDSCREVKLIETRFGWMLGGAFSSSKATHSHHSKQQIVRQQVSFTNSSYIK